MKREILFRGKRVDNGEWIEGLLFYSHGLGEFKITCSNGWIPSYNNPDEGESTEYHNIKHETIGQFTGLTDKNEVKIFEGDIINDWAGIRAVKFEIYDNYQGYDLEPDDINCEVVGNIHDNTELL